MVANGVARNWRFSSALRKSTMTRITPKKLEKHILKAVNSNIAKSTRRFFFNHLTKSTEERGHFHVDFMYGAGSGVLLNIEDKYFVLTAKHVINKNLNGDFQNESPFWITSKNKSDFSSLYNFLFPKGLWNIGDLMPKIDAEIDVSDLCLVELFDPPKFHIPDHFIKIESESSVMKKSEFFEGQYLLVTGYPFERNNFDFNPIDHNYTHSTKIQRHSIPGIYINSASLGYISFEMTKGDYQHENLNGMSGGAIYNIQPKANMVKLAGIPITAGNNICRFIPSYLFVNALMQYKKSSFTVIDPIVNVPPSLDDVMKVTLEYLRDDAVFKIPVWARW